MADENNPTLVNGKPITNGVTTVEKFKFQWKDFWIYGLMWVLIFGAAQGVFWVGQKIVDQQRMIRDLIEQNQGGEGDVSPFDSRGSEVPLERWVAFNLPRNCFKEKDAAADVFDSVAEMLLSGDLRGMNDAFSEAVAQLQPVVTRKNWVGFLTKLTLRAKKEKIQNTDDLAVVFQKIASGLRGRSARIENMFSDIVPVESEAKPAEPETQNQPEAEAKPDTAGKAAEPVKSESTQCVKTANGTLVCKPQ